MSTAIFENDRGVTRFGETDTTWPASFPVGAQYSTHTPDSCSKDRQTVTGTLARHNDLDQGIRYKVSAKMV